MMLKMDSMMSMLTKERENVPTTNAFDASDSIEESAHFELSNEEDEDIVLPFVDDGTLHQLTSK